MLGACLAHRKANFAPPGHPTCLPTGAAALRSSTRTHSSTPWATRSRTPRSRAARLAVIPHGYKSAFNSTALPSPTWPRVGTHKSRLTARRSGGGTAGSDGALIAMAAWRWAPRCGPAGHAGWSISLMYA